jgi:hypothetical protein
MYCAATLETVDMKRVHILSYLICITFPLVQWREAIIVVTATFTTVNRIEVALFIAVF